MDVDLSEKFQFAIPFEDRASELKLSSKQAAEFDCWVRPHEICSDPKLIVGDHVDCFSIKQTVSITNILGNKKVWLFKIVILIENARLEPTLPLILYILCKKKG